MRIRRIVVILVLSSIVLANIACTVTNERRIVGTYRAECPCVSITLILNRDQSFVQRVRPASGETKELGGKWFVRDKIVHFTPFFDFSQDYRGINSGVGETGFIPELWPRGMTMGPIVVQCPESAYELDYVK